jgi:glycosyltransferase involved in cell wall biosynthesis
MSKILTIGMPTFDDYDGVYFSLQSLRLHHPEILDRTAFLVVDNNPDSARGKAVERLCATLPDCRYRPYRQNTGTAAAKEQVFQAADTEWVLCMDSHILFPPNTLAKFLWFCEDHPDCKDLLQGPLLYDDLQGVSTHFEARWGSGMYGQWSARQPVAALPAEPFPIPMQGMGVFACRREAWLGFNPEFKGFGGEEWYIHEKYRQAGRQTLCLPFLLWNHRFGRPAGLPYPNTWEDRVRNYLLGHRELGIDTTAMDAHFKEFLGGAYQGIRAKAG